MGLAFRNFNAKPSRSSLGGEKLAGLILFLARLENCELRLSNCIVSMLWRLPIAAFQVSVRKTQLRFVHFFFKPLKSYASNQTKISRSGHP